MSHCEPRSIVTVRMLGQAARGLVYSGLVAETENAAPVVFYSPANFRGVDSICFLSPETALVRA